MIADFFIVLALPRWSPFLRDKNGIPRAVLNCDNCELTKERFSSNLTIDTANSTEDCLYLNVWTPDDCVLNETCQPKKWVLLINVETISLVLCSKLIDIISSDM